MFDELTNSMPLKFLGAFIVVLLLIGLAAWLVRRFGAGRLDAAARGRQPRLAVVDSASVDGRRKLVIVRRDNVEHLLMIGGPTDVVVETAIMRGAAVASRETPARNGGNESALRAMPLPDPTPWPLQPEPAPAAPAAPVLRAERGFRGDDTWPESAEPPGPPVNAAPAVQPPMVRPVRPADTLAGLAEELARPERSEAPRPERSEALRSAAAATSAAAPPSEQSLAEMAQRLEAALRRPGAQKIVSEGQRVTTIVEVKAAQPKPAVGTAAAAAAAPPKANPPGKPQAQPQPPASQAPQAPSQPTDLEQEMASLLGRTGKT